MSTIDDKRDNLCANGPFQGSSVSTQENMRNSKDTINVNAHALLVNPYSFVTFEVRKHVQTPSNVGGSGQNISSLKKLRYQKS